MNNSEWAVKRHEVIESWWRKEDWNKPLGRWQLWVPLNCLTHYCSSTAVHGDGVLRERKALGWAPTAGEWKKGVFLKPPEGRYKEPLRCFGLLTTSCIRARHQNTQHLERHECGLTEFWDIYGTIYMHGGSGVTALCGRFGKQISAASTQMTLVHILLLL